MADEQGSLFPSGESIVSDATGDQPGEGGATPTSPLQISPKQLRIEPILREQARTVWLTKHYMHRDLSCPSLELGFFSPQRELVGAIAFTAYVPWAPKGGRPNTWELRRLWLDDRCAKNSESRMIRISLKLVKKLAPHVYKIITYADPAVGHKGTIYKAAGFSYDGRAGISMTGNAYGATKDINYTVEKKRYVCILR